MVALSIFAGLLILGVALGAFDFDRLLDGTLSDAATGDDSEDRDEVETVEGSTGNDFLETGNHKHIHISMAFLNNKIVPICDN